MDQKGQHKNCPFNFMYFDEQLKNVRKKWNSRKEVLRYTLSIFLTSFPISQDTVLIFLRNNSDCQTRKNVRENRNIFQKAQFIVQNSS